MTIWKKNGFVRTVAFVLVAAILGVVSGPALSYGGQDICQRALWDCFGSALDSALETLGSSLVSAIPYCLNGYIFCEKYVANFLR